MTKLDRCWKNCLRMWKWIAENWEPNKSIDKMKAVWLKKHGFTRAIAADCFFCEYHHNKGGGARKYRGGDYCADCPGGYVSKSFDCYSPHYHFYLKPVAFYRKLLELDKKRKAK